MITKHDWRDMTRDGGTRTTPKLAPVVAQNEENRKNEKASHLGSLIRLFQGSLGCDIDSPQRHKNRVTKVDPRSPGCIRVELARLMNLHAIFAFSLHLLWQKSKLTSGFHTLRMLTPPLRNGLVTN